MPDSVLHFFTGENDYALEKEVSRWRQAFCQKHGNENFLVLDAAVVTVSDILDAVSIMPFIAEKRLVLIRGIPKIDKEDIQTVVDNVHPQVIVAVVESKPDKRLSAVKALTEVADMKTFPLLSERELTSWANALVQAEGGSIDAQALKLLFEVVGTDQWTLESELKKLVLFAPHGTITQQHIDVLAVPSGEQVIWKFTDLIGSRRADDALKFLANRLERGEEPYGMWTILLNMVKNLTLVWACMQDGLRDEKSIASAAGISFYAVRGLMPLAKSLNAERMRQLVSFAADADIALKTGGYHDSSENHNEVIALTERAIMMCR